MSGTEREPARQYAANRRDVRFLLTMARALHTAGTTAQRLEDSLALIARGLGITNAQFFSTPTSIMCAFGELERQETHLLRLAPAGPNIGRLSKLDRVVSDVLDTKITTTEALQRVEEIEKAPSPYGVLVTVFAFGLGSAGIARFLGGGVKEILVGAMLGLITGSLEALAEWRPSLERVYEPIAAFVAAFLATSLATLLGPYAASTAILAGIIVLLPGLVLTNAVRELAERHLASGTARLAGAVMILLALVFGVALGDRAAVLLFGNIRELSPVALPWWTLGVAIVATGASFVVILKAEPRDTAWIVGACATSYLLASTSVRLAGPEIGLFVAALSDGLAAALWGRWRDRPQSVVLVPAILMLVPGSVGFRSLNSLLEQNVIAGVQTAFAMILAATALSAGLLVATSVGEGWRRMRKGPRVPILTDEHPAMPMPPL
ncbi:MAG: threonine/serine exporter family protein [Gemmatimonadota bacterium]